MGQITKNLDSLKMGNKIIEKMASINITGNIIPMIWFKKILYPSFSSSSSVTFAVSYTIPTLPQK